MTFLLLVIPFILLSVWAASRVKGSFRKWSHVPIRSGYSGAEAAQIILRGAGIHDVTIEGVPGMLSDHYDPRSKTVRLSEEVLNGRSVAAVAVAAHEVGHAIQHAQAYKPMEWRSSMVPAMNFASQSLIPLVFMGFLFGLPGLAWLGVIGFGIAVLFHLVTLPVEYDASRRAIQIVERSGIAQPGEEMTGIRKTLNAAGFTYVASTLVAAAQLLMFLLPLLAGHDE